jgi:hypothetical protein
MCESPVLQLGNVIIGQHNGHIVVSAVGQGGVYEQIAKAGYSSGWSGCPTA